MRILLFIAFLLLAACASLSGSTLVPGKSTAQEVEALMGAPAERIRLPDGDSNWYYPRQPDGRVMFVVRVSPDGVVRSREQVLTEQNLTRLARGATTREQAREIIGPPWRTSRFERQERDVWEYTMYNAEQMDYFLYLQFSFDGVLREVMMLKDYAKEPGGSSKD
ncbi:MAG: outer membrane protein assembly factor BamE [Burkholderiales bacterium]|nr:outer membrane protein assembly factor BamE [Burkholderiales bacterium]